MGKVTRITRNGVVIFITLIVITVILRIIFEDSKWYFETFTQPLSFILTAILIQKAIADEQLKTNQENLQKEILEKYLESLEKLLLNDNINYPQAMKIVRFKTLTILTRLTFNSEHDKAIILKVLYHTGLIKSENNKPSKLNLESCDFQEINLCGEFLAQIDLHQTILNKANFHNAILSQSILYGASFSKTNLNGASLNGASLMGTNFVETNFIEANFSHADLSQTNFNRVNLNGANFYGADLFRANLCGANLNGAYLNGARLTEAKFSNNQIKLTKYWEEAVYTEAEWNQFHRKWVPIDEKINKAKIKEIRDSD